MPFVDRRVRWTRLILVVRVAVAAVVSQNVEELSGRIGTGLARVVLDIAIANDVLEHSSDFFLSATDHAAFFVFIILAFGLSERVACEESSG